MSVRIRLKRMGKKKHPFYRIVAADSRRARDGRFIEMLGYYNPMTDPADVKLDYDKIYKWLDRGAQPSENVTNLLRSDGLLEKWRLLKEGVKITELDAVIEERRKKQPGKTPKIDKAEKVVEDTKEDKPEKAVEDTKEDEPEKEVEEKEVKKSVKSEKVKEPAAEDKKAEKKVEAGKEDKIEKKEDADQKSEIPQDSEESSEVKDETKEG